MYELFKILTLQSGYNTSVVLVGTAALGISGGVIGTFCVLRGRALLTDAMAHSTLPGLVISYLICQAFGIPGKPLPILLIGAGVSAFLATTVIFGIERFTRLSSDTAVAAVLSVFFGLGIVLLSVLQNSGIGGGINRFIYGQTAAMSSIDSSIAAILAIACVVASFVVLKELRLVCFDSEYAEVQGWPVWIIDLILMTMVLVVTLVGLQSVGLLLIVALLIIPTCAARLWSDRLGSMLVLSAGLGGASAYLGSAISALYPNLPAGSVIVTTAGTVFGISAVFSPTHGAIIRYLGHLSLRFRMTRDHIFRLFYENREKGLLSIPISKLLLRSDSSIAVSVMVLFAVIVRQEVAISGASLNLTESGMEVAKAIANNHRLWEMYWSVYGSIDAAHVDYSADLAEHVLTPEIIELLENELRSKDVDVNTIKSIHPV